MTRPQDQRPLSPHLQVYRWQISNTLSILHRATGFGLSFGLALFAAWLISAAYYPDCYAQIQALAGSIVGKLFLFGWTLAFFYHLGNGIRHLNWDMGRGFSIPEMTASGWVVVVFTLSLTVLTWAIIIRKVGL
jgi:succinate dehydrogenase / fumarate reductase cytochrome b subunit